jgi:hypothetical protein
VHGQSSSASLRSRSGEPAGRELPAAAQAARALAGHGFGIVDGGVPIAMMRKKRGRETSCGGPTPNQLISYALEVKPKPGCACDPSVHQFSSLFFDCNATSDLCLGDILINC